MSRGGPSRTASIEIVGASANNLKSVDIEIPRGAATMLVGPSGSGKSSLLADTLATEANARLKRFLGVAQDHLEEKEVPAFLGALPPCIHFAQGGFRASQRTTVATCSGLLGTLRRLFLKHSVPWADPPGEPVPPPSPETYAAWLRRHHRGRLTASAVPLRFVASDGAEAARRLSRLGFETAVLRSETDPPAVWEKGRPVRLAGFKPLPAHVRHILEVEVGTETLPSRKSGSLESLLEKAFEAGRGTVVVELHGGGPEVLQGPRGLCLDSDLHHVHPAAAAPFFPPSAPLLSFNMPGSERSGACRECLGTGQALTVPEEALVTRPDRSLHEGALSLWTEKNYKHVNIQHETVEGLRGLQGFDPGVPWKRLTEKARKLVLQGSGGQGIEDRDRRTGRRLSAPRPFEGFVPAILRRYSAGSSAGARLGHLVRQGPCPSCGGTRWSPQARALRVGDFGIADLLATSFSELTLLMEPGGPFARSAPKSASTMISLLHHQAKSFAAVGLGHLSGDRGMLTVSEGESRRVRLAGLLAVRGQGLGLLLDEPARGLHEQDIAGLVESLRRLTRSHTVVLNDHRLSIARGVDHVVELGPGAGERGGRIVRCGPPAEVLKAGAEARLDRRQLPVRDNDPFLEVRGANLHTLRDIDGRIPLGRLVCLTGVSGSGKSNFVRGILVPALLAELGGKVDVEGFSLRQQGSWKKLTGAGRIAEVLALDQRNPEANRRSLVATYLGIAEGLRKTFAAAPEARRLRLAATDFGLNAGRGRCPDCLGLGEREEPGGWVPCPRCGGRRFGEEALAVRLAGFNVAELLDLPVEELASRDLPLPEGFSALWGLLVDLDLGYVTLGRRVDRLSGGEVQRLRIAHRLWKRGTKGLLLILDEPSAGLHPRDVERLLVVLDRIVGQGENTVVLIEHNLDLMRISDWIIDFGPGGGPAGGKIVGQGPPEAITRLGTPTGKALREPASWKGLPSSPRAGAAGQPHPDEVDPASARAARASLQRLLGHEVAIPESASDDDRDLTLAVEIDEGLLATRRPHEIGDIDLELGRLFLAASLPPPDLERLATIWGKTPDGHLVVQPLLPELQVWGPRIPASALKSAIARMKSLRLVPATHLEKTEPVDLRARVSVQPEPTTPDARRRALADALSLGGGYVELRDPKGRVLGLARTRCLDLAQGIVAPLALTSAGLSRSHVSGTCPACRGKGTLPALDPDLLVRPASPESETFFTREALAILKGVRRSIMLPFFRRLAEEGLWDVRKHLDRLGREEKDLFLHGYWHRPGPGSFLKDRNSDPQEVSSWLRWDGLVRHVLEQLDRSRDADWAETVRKSLHQRTCFVCQGTGLAFHSRVVERAGRSLHDWVLRGTAGEIQKAFRQSSCQTERERRTLARVLHCLEPLARKSEARLREPIGDPVLGRAVYEQVLRSFTSLGIVR
ncbi:MAG TPA: hypothetical protein VN493_08000 [Thermoanaerobaculia bacterium]|nr:hypothetical protein [Thermoanaerobaculia bacterium]